MAMSAWEKKQAEKEQEKIRDLCIDGLLAEKVWEKQWWIEKILEAIGVDLAELRKEIERQGYLWEPGEEP